MKCVILVFPTLVPVWNSPGNLVLDSHKVAVYIHF